MGMHALSSLGRWDEFGLALNRYMLCGTALWASVVSFRMLRVRRSRRVTIVPRPVIWFSFLWNATLAALTFALAAFDVGPISSGWFRAIYATIIVWALFGVTWIVSHGTKGSVAALDIVEALDKAVQDANRRKDEDDER